MNVDGYIKYLRSFSQPLKIMEVCGTHTESVVKNGIRGLLPPNIRLVSGPGCPVCVTESGFIDGLISFSQQEDSCVLSFGDLFRIRGSSLSFSEARSSGGKFKTVYSPFEALSYAKNNPDIHYAFAAVGFETTIPIYALLIDTMVKENIGNLKLALSVKTMIPAIEFICVNETVDAFICPGHVSVVIGKNAFHPLCERYRKPFVIAGFEPERIIAAICEIAAQTGSGKYNVRNMYKSVVSDCGNETALGLIYRYFTKADGYWRGIGMIKDSALTLKDAFSSFALHSTAAAEAPLPSGCRCADVLLGRITPAECGLFAKTCRADNPVGSCMTSREGACAVWYESYNIR